MRGAVTWKSVVGTNVAADALSNLASAGVIGGALVVVGEDYGAGASVIQERTHAFALKSSLLLFDPRPSLQNLATMVAEAFAMSEASNLPAVISLRIRTAHMRGTMICEDNVRPAISVRNPLQAPSFDYGRLSHPPSTYAQEVHKFERGSPPRAGTSGPAGSIRSCRASGRTSALSCRAGSRPPCSGLGAGGEATPMAKRIPLFVLNVIHPSCRRRSLRSWRASRACS